MYGGRPISDQRRQSRLFRQLLLEAVRHASLIEDYRRESFPANTGFRPLPQAHVPSLAANSTRETGSEQGSIICTDRPPGRVDWQLLFRLECAGAHQPTSRFATQNLWSVAEAHLFTGKHRLFMGEHLKSHILHPTFGLELVRQRTDCVLSLRRPSSSGRGRDKELFRRAR